MITLTRPEGTEVQDLNLSRRMLGGAFFAGYAAFAFSADAAPIHTDEAGLITGIVQLPANDRPIRAYVARPRVRVRSPVVLVVSEVFGIHEYVRDVCRRLAKAGYVAIAPDFFVRHGDPAPLSDFTAIRKIVEQATEAEVTGDIRAALRWARAQTFTDRKRMAITGFCWGGAVTWLACAQLSDFRCGVAWYGRLTRPKAGEFLSDPGRRWPLELAPALKAPVLGLYGGKDQGIPQTDVEAMRAALRASGKVGSDLVVYPQASHGFHADYRPAYDAAAAQDGWTRMLAFFAANGVKPKR
jgi:carboxymethylenebutenolidase